MNTRSLLVFLLIFLASCGVDREKKQSSEANRLPPKVDVPPFNADSAYVFVEKQVDFGPRIPNTPAHRETADYLINTLKRYGANLTVQEFDAKTFDGQNLRLKNIIAAFNPSATKRVLLGAHWDTRPFADKDDENPRSTFQGANDGASGVGVLLEIARILATSPLPEVGVDIILFDGEDWGEREGEQGTHPLPDGLREWWCLGSQHWSKNKHQAGYSAFYGILLDMVGAQNAQFHREGYSMDFAPSVVDKVWNHAQRLGYSHVFIRKTQEGVIDDHVFVSTIARIPMINIVHFEPGIGYFGTFHHTQEDNLELISKEMLDAVGTTVLNTIYYER